MTRPPSPHLWISGISMPKLIDFSQGQFVPQIVKECTQCFGRISLVLAHTKETSYWHIGEPPPSNGNPQSAIALINDQSEAQSKQLISRLANALDSNSDAQPVSDEKWMSVAITASLRSPSLSHKVGAAIVMDDKLIATGVNEILHRGESNPGLYPDSPLHHLDPPLYVETRRERVFRGLFDELRSCGLQEDKIELVESGSSIAQLRELMDVETAVHAEVAAICSSSLLGVSVNGAIIYSTYQPCYRCLRFAAAFGVNRIVYLRDADDHLTSSLRSQLTPAISICRFQGLILRNIEYLRDIL